MTLLIQLQVGSHTAHAGKPRSVSMRQPPVSSSRRGSDYTGHIPASLKRHNPEAVVENGTDDNPSLVHKGVAQNPNRAEMPNSSTSTKRKGSYDYTSVSYKSLLIVVCYDLP